VIAAHAQASAPARPTWLLVAMSVLFFGPLVVPLFRATDLWPLEPLGSFAHLVLATYICPTPAKSYWLLNHEMGVCARCWGGTIGLWVAWFGTHAWRLGAVRPAWLVQYLALPWLARLGLSALPFWLWIAEIVRWPTAPLPVLLVNGVVAGTAAGIFFLSVWPGVLPRAVRP
jgi:hypothetical protein